jgi:hypothetical protein
MLLCSNELFVVLAALGGMRDRRTLPSRQRTYRRLHVRVDRLEDAISHFHNVINELRGRVLTLEKQLKPSAKDGDLSGSGGAPARIALRHDIANAGRWSSRLVAAAAEDRLSFRRNSIRCIA